mmetsp:Transcript_18671/g.72026  ORF Transcript_18671/g.72026 Transcript_18671/m.72026 type:complete len:170 (+) Transcript_18671:422-931(+)
MSAGFYRFSASYQQLLPLQRGSTVLVGLVPRQTAVLLTALCSNAKEDCVGMDFFGFPASFEGVLPSSKLEDFQESDVLRVIRSNLLPNKLWKPPFPLSPSADYRTQVYDAAEYLGEEWMVFELRDLFDVTMVTLFSNARGGGGQRRDGGAARDGAQCPAHGGWLLRVPI